MLEYSTVVEENWTEEYKGRAWTRVADGTITKYRTTFRNYNPNRVVFYSA